MAVGICARMASSAAAISVESCAARLRARSALATVSRVRAYSRAGAQRTLSASPMVWPVEATISRMRSISSPKNSTRTGWVPWAGKTSKRSPRIPKVPGSSASPAAT